MELNSGNDKKGEIGFEQGQDLDKMSADVIITKKKGLGPNLIQWDPSYLERSFVSLKDDQDTRVNCFSP
jgi:hypothetical protein